MSLRVHYYLQRTHLFGAHFFGVKGKVNQHTSIHATIHPYIYTSTHTQALPGNMLVFAWPGNSTFLYLARSVRSCFPFSHRLLLFPCPAPQPVHSQLQPATVCLKHVVVGNFK